jgi:hypothetical protein
MAGAEFKLWINDELVLSKEFLKTYEQVGLNPERTPQTAAEKAAWDKVGTFRYRNCDKGRARAEIVRDPSQEEDIANARKMIKDHLDEAYRDLKEKMAPYQEQWERYGWDSIEIAAAQGLKESAVGWIDDKTEMLTKKYWTDMADDMKAKVSSTLDAAEATVNKAARTIEDAYDHREVVLESAWWHAQAEHAVEYTKEKAREIEKSIVDGAAFAERTAHAAKVIFEHRKQILALPEKVVAGDVDAIEDFIDSVLSEVAPEAAAKLRYDHTWQGTIELLQEGEAASIFGVYLNLFLTVAPPNFWAHHAGRLGFYVLVEIILILIGCLLGGAGAVGRIALISERLAEMGGAAARVGRVLDRGLEALESAKRMIKAFEKAILDIEKLKKKLMEARRRLMKNGFTRSILKHFRKTKPRRGECRLCHSTKHPTPINRHGHIDYR